MSFELFIFYFFAAVMVFAAARVITARNPVHAALFLVLTFFTASAIWLLLEAEFLAITLVLVYVGAVMVLFLFVVMMLDINVEPLREGFVKYLPVGALVGVIMLVEMVFLITQRFFKSENYDIPARASADQISNTEMLGQLLYSQYLLQFEIAAIILLVAIVAAIALTMRRRPTTKYQIPSAQIDVRKEDRLKVVKMPAEKQ